MSSTRVLLALTTRLFVALPAMSPPIRKNVSCTEIGLLAWLAVDPAVPTVSRALELVVPASKSRPSIRTPSTSATCLVFTPLAGMRAGKPTPSATVFGLVTLSVRLMVETPGVTHRLQPCARAALICAAVCDGVATKNWLIGSEVAEVELPAQLAPDAFVRRLGRNTW